jgi:hypothetical protein
MSLEILSAVMTLERSDEGIPLSGCHPEERSDEGSLICKRNSRSFTAFRMTAEGFADVFEGRLPARPFFYCHQGIWVMLPLNGIYL